jgi:hypothetical protein
MAQYQQKTDSREFAISDPSQSSALPGDAVLDAAEIAVRFWIPDGSDRSQTLTWTTDSVLIYMIADLVCATGGRLSEETSAGMLAHFDSSWQALVAAKRIQTSILDFRAYRPAEGLGAAILIFQPMPDDPAGSSAQVQRALRQATPGQILLAENVSQHLRNVPGIEFRMVPALTTDGDQQPGLVELVFDSPKQDAAWSPSPARATAAGSDLPLIGATMIVQSPFERGTRAPNESSTATGTGDFAVGDESLGSKSSASAHSRDLNPVREALPGGSSDLLTEELNDSEQRPPTRTKVLLAAAALAVIVAVIFVIFRSGSEAKIKTPPQPQVQTEGSGTPDKAIPAVPDANTQPTQPVPAPQKPVSKEPAVAQKPSAAKPAQKRVIVNQAAEEPPPPTDAEGISVKDIPRLLEWGRRDLGNGSYDQARREFSQVLRLDPSNQAAKDGLRKVALAQSDSQ